MRSKLHSSRQPYVGIAIVAWNNEEILPQCLDSIRAQTYKNIKTIVIDNNSSDDSVNLIKSHYPWVDLIESSENTGFAKGNNQIIKEFIRDREINYVVLLNSDASLEPGWVESLVSFARGKPRAAFLQGATLDYYDHDVVDSTHLYVNRKGQSIQGGYRQPIAELPKKALKIFGTNAAACMLSRRYLEMQPFDYLFDEDFFMYLEDVDIAARSVVLGWDSYFVPEALAYHMGSASSGKNPGYSVYMVNRNRWPLLVKNLPLGIIISIIPGMIAGDIQELYRIARARNFLVVWKFISGRILGFFMAFSYLNKRRTITKARKISTKELWRLMKFGYKG